MKKFGVILCAVMGLLVSGCSRVGQEAGPQDAQTYGTRQAGDFEIEITDGEVTISKYVGSGSQVVIPAIIEGLPVRIIGGEAFAECASLISVVLPESIKSIGYFAFSNCTNLSSIVLPNSVTSIEGHAFCGCDSLTKIAIPSSVVDIGEDIFGRCHNLSAITVNKGNRQFADVDGVLFTKDGTSLIQYPAGKKGAYTIPGGVVFIEVHAFSGCTELTGVTIPNSVSYIGEIAFAGCDSLTDITIPKSVTSIGEFSFCYTELKTLTMPVNIEYIGECAFPEGVAITYSE